MVEWRATHEEQRRALPGDELVPEAGSPATHAVTIDAPPEAVWPWLLQMGCDRGGWYSWDRLDNGGRPSADRIVPELQQVRVGDVWPSRPGSHDGFEVLRLDRPRDLLLGAYLSFPGSRSMPWDAPPPKGYVRAVWSFHLEPVDGGTRLVVRVRGVTKPWLARVVMNVLFGKPVHAFMQRKQLLNLKARAEAMG